MNGKIFPTVIMCILFAAFCLFVMAETAMKDQAGKVIIRSLPLECEVSFRGQDIHKVEDQITIEAIPAGSYPIIFKLGDKMLKAELDIRAGAALLVNCRFKRGNVLVTSGVFVGKDGAAMVLIRVNSRWAAMSASLMKSRCMRSMSMPFTWTFTK